MADTSNRSTGPSTSMAGGRAAAAHRAPATSRELLPHQRGETLSDVRTAGNTEPRAEETQAGTLSNFHDNCNGVFAGLGAPGCAGTRSLGTEQDQLLLRSHPEQAAMPREQVSAGSAPRTSQGEPRFPQPQRCPAREAAGLTSGSTDWGCFPRHGSPKSCCPSSPTVGRAPCTEGRVWGSLG